MTIEASQTINELNPSFPRSTDLLKEGDDHIRLIKANIKRTFPSITGPVRLTSDAMNNLGDMMQVSSAGLRLTKPFYVDSSATIQSDLQASNITATGTVWANAVEIRGGTPFIDFHYQSSTSDFTHRIIADNANRLVVSSNLRINGELASDSNITAVGDISASRSISAAGDISTKSGFIASGNARIQGNLNLGTLTMNGDIGNVNVLHAQAVETAQWVHASAEVTAAGEMRGGYVHSTGDVRGDSSVIAENGAVYSGGVGGGQLAHDGNVYGSQWGGWLRNWIDNNTLRAQNGRMHDFHWDINGKFAWITDASPFYMNPISGSDIKLKENIKSVESKPSYDAINAIPLVSFKYKNTEAIPNGKTYLAGFIAQEVEKLLPDVIDTLDDTKYVDQFALINHLIAAVQYLSKEVEELKAKVK